MTSYVRDENIVARSVGGELVLVPVRSNVGDLDSVFTVSDVGREIWNCLESPRSIAELVDRVTAEFDVDPAAAEKDVAGFLATLRDAGLIRSIEE
jgi:hypothetical protein